MRLVTATTLALAGALTIAQVHAQMGGMQETAHKVANGGMITDSANTKAVWIAQERPKTRKPTRPSHPALFTCLAYSPTMPSRRRRHMAVFNPVMMAQALVLTDATTSAGWIG